MRYIFQLLVVSAVTSSMNSLDLECTTSQNNDYQRYNGETIRMCSVNNLNVQTPKQRIITVNQSAQPKDYTGLSIRSKTMHYVLEGIGKFFPKLAFLDIYNSGLKIIEADDLRNLTELVVLKLEHNALEFLESDLFKFNPKLKYINFNNNKIRFVGADFLNELTNLETGFFQSNICTNSYQSSVNYISKLIRTLKSSCPVPESMKRQYAEISSLKAVLKNMQEKYYYNSCDGNLNTATTILYEMEQKCNQLPTNEGRSNLASNSVVEVSFESDEWTEVKVVSKNTQISIPNLRNGNETLRKIYIEHQQMFYLPTNFGEVFPKLEELSVIYSGVYEVDETVFENMNDLKTLNLTGNKLQKVLVPVFDELDSLETLDLSHNNIKSLELAIFKKMIQLRTIKLNHNSLKSLDGTYFESSRNLSKVYLNNNKLRFISANLLSTLKNLQTVNLKNNTCIDLRHPDVTFSVVEAKIIKSCIAPIKVHCEEALSDQNVSIQCSVKLTIDFPKTKILNFFNTSLTNVKIFKVVGQKMKFLPLELNKVFTKLNELIVVNSNLTALQQSDFMGLNLLKIIEITFNNISSIEDGTFSEVPELEYLNLSENSITALPSKIFSKLHKMKFLILAGNKLKKFTADFLPKKNGLQELLVQGNQLELIETKMLRLVRKTTKIDFSGNECIDLKYEKTNSSRSMVEVFGEIYLNCSGDSSYEDFSN